MPMPPMPRGMPPPPAQPAGDQLIEGVMKLTPAQLAQLPPDRRAKIEMLRDKISRGMGAGDGRDLL